MVGRVCAVSVALLPLSASASDLVEVPADRVELRATSSSTEGESQVLYLNRCDGGVTVSEGVDDARTDRSSLVDGAVRLPAFPFSDATWTQTVTHTREIFTRFNVFVTDVDPGLANHDEVFVCGDPALLGGGDDLGGLAPFTCSGPIRNAVAFVFAERIGDRPRVLAETIAHEAAHAWGLDHAVLCTDAMSYLECGDKEFVNQAAPCGENTERPCTCERESQNSAAHLLALFGPGPGQAPPETSGGCSAAPRGTRGPIGPGAAALLGLLAVAYRTRARGIR